MLWLVKSTALLLLEQNQDITLLLRGEKEVETELCQVMSPKSHILKHIPLCST